MSIRAEIEGKLTKQIKQGIGKNGRRWMLRTVSVYDGKNKETGESKYIYVSFFVKEDDIDTFDALPGRTEVRLYGKPVPKKFVTREGVEILSIQLEPAWEDWFEILSEPEQIPMPDVSGESEEPF